jgi:FdhE protein
MIQPATDRLEQLAQADAAVAPLAWLQLEALRASTEPGWETGIPTLGTSHLLQGAPLLDGLTLGVDPGQVGRLWSRLASASERQNPEGAGRLTSVGDVATFDTLALMEASLIGNEIRLAQCAEQLEVELPFMATLGHLATLPLLQACGRKAEPLLGAVTWQAGYCPVCGAWPTLAELRGLERERWLRCGRCGAGWRFNRQACVFCGNNDHHSQGYLAGDEQRDTRRAETCEQCRGYLKTLAALGAFTPTEVLAQDLASVELDMAALEQGYARPEKPGWTLRTSLEPLPGRADGDDASKGARRHGWTPWRK